MVLGLLPFAAGLRPWVSTTDQAGCLAYGHSLLTDGDLNLLNQLRAWGMPWSLMDVTPAQQIGDLYPPGASILAIPFLAAGWALDAAAGNSARGLSPEISFTVGAAAAGLACLGFWGVFLSGLAALGTAPPRAVWPAAIGLMFGSPLLFYILDEPFMPHAAAMFTASLFTWLWLRTGATAAASRHFLLGLSLGTASLTRSESVLFALLPVSSWLKARVCRGEVPIAARSIAWFAAGIALAILPQLAIWNVLYGDPFSAPEGHNILWTRPLFWHTLFSSYHGVFIWTPIILLALIGLGAGIKKSPWLMAPMITVVLLFLYLSAACKNWWMGNAFGQRILLTCFPLFVQGLSVLLAGRWRRIAAIVTVCCAVWTTGLFLQVRLGWIDLGQVQTLLQLSEGQLRLLTRPVEGVAALFHPWLSTAGDWVALGGFSIALAALSLWSGRRLARLTSGSWRGERVVAASAAALFVILTVSFAGGREPLSSVEYAQIKSEVWLPHDQRIDIGWRLTEGIYAAKTGRLDWAEESFRAAIEIDPTNLDSQFQLGQLLLSSGRYQEALEHLSSSKHLAPDDPDVWRALAATYFHLGDQTAALREYQQLLRVLPNDFEALANSAAVFANLGRSDLAQYYIQEALKINPSWRDGQLELQRLNRISSAKTTN